MLVALSNVPRDYDWGSATLLPELQGRAPSGAPEAEVWFGDHPGSPAMTPDGRSLNVWLEDEAA
ncbi:MAG: type I phosphomannose isomerase catalytic subunit, partial [Microbacterium sp.]